MASWYVNHVTGSTGRDSIAVLQLDSYPSDLGLSVFRHLLSQSTCAWNDTLQGGKKSGDA